MSDLAFTDANLTLGRRSTPRPENDLDTDQFLAELAHAGISGALAYHAYAREYDPRIGNEQLSELVAQYPQFLPCYVVQPHHAGSFPTGDPLLHYLKEGGARAVRLFPNDHSFGLGETWCGDLYSTLEEAGVPLLLDFDQTDWPEIDRILAIHPSLQLILLRVGYRIDHWLYPLLDKYEGLYIEPALYPLHRGIESLVEKFGAKRLIFGSGLPLWDAGAAVSQIRYAQIDPADRRKIAGENLRSLLWYETAPRTASSTVEAAPADAIWSRVRAGQILDDLLVIDAHTHMGAWYNFNIPGDPWAEGMIAAMDDSGVDIAVTAPHAALGPAMSLGNRQAADAIEKFPGRFYAYCTVNPNYPAAEILAELEKWLAHDGFRGIKIHPTTHDYPADGDGYRPMWEFAQDRKLPVLIHTWDGDPRCRPSLFEPLAREFTQVQFLLGHSGATPNGIREAMRVANAVPNAHLDLTKSLVHRGMVEGMVAGVGADRILFGSDLPFIGGTGQVGHVAAARISEEEKRKIFGLNAKKLFGL